MPTRGDPATRPVSVVLRWGRELMSAASARTGRVAAVHSSAVLQRTVTAQGWSCRRHRAVSVADEPIQRSTLWHPREPLAVDGSLLC